MGEQETVLIPVESVLYVGIELSPDKNIFVLNVHDHEDIMCWLTA